MVACSCAVRCNIETSTDYNRSLLSLCTRLWDRCVCV